MEPVHSDHDQQADSTESNVEFIRFKRSHLYAVLLPLAFVAGLASGFLIWADYPSPGIRVIEETSSIITEERVHYSLHG